MAPPFVKRDGEEGGAGRRRNARVARWYNQRQRPHLAFLSMPSPGTMTKIQAVPVPRCTCGLCAMRHASAILEGGNQARYPVVSRWNASNHRMPLASRQRPTERFWQSCITSYAQVRGRITLNRPARELLNHPAFASRVYDRLPEDTVL